MASLCLRPWVVYAKRPFSSPARVLKYLARYTHQTACAHATSQTRTCYDSVGKRDGLISDIGSLANPTTFNGIGAEECLQIHLSDQPLQGPPCASSQTDGVLSIVGFRDWLLNNSTHTVTCPK